MVIHTSGGASVALKLDLYMFFHVLEKHVPVPGARAHRSCITRIHHENYPNLAYLDMLIRF